MTGRSKAGATFIVMCCFCILSGFINPLNYVSVFYLPGDQNTVNFSQFETREHFKGSTTELLTYKKSKKELLYGLARQYCVFLLSLHN